MHLLCIYLDRLEPEKLLQPCQKEDPHIFFGDLQTMDGIFITTVATPSSSLNFKLHSEHISMCLEEGCLINVTPVYHLCMVESKWR